MPTSFLGCFLHLSVRGGTAGDLGPSIDVCEFALLFQVLLFPYQLSACVKPVTASSNFVVVSKSSL